LPYALVDAGASIKICESQRYFWWSLRGAGQQAILVVVNIRNKNLKSKVPPDYRARSFVNLLDQSTAYLKEELELEPYGIRLLKTFKP